MKKFTKELGPGWITLVENDDYALSRLIFGDGLEVDCDEEETPLLKKGFQQIQEYWTGHRVIFTLPLAPGGSDFEREVWETVIRIPYGEHFTTPTLLAALALEDTEENRARVIKAVDDCPIPIFIPTHRVGDPETEHDEEYHYPAGEDVKGAFMALEHPLDEEENWAGGRPQAARAKPGHLAAQRAGPMRSIGACGRTKALQKREKRHPQRMPLFCVLFYWGK